MSDTAEFQPADLERHRAFLQHLARELVRGEQAAEDLVQEAFVRALERPPRSGAALGAWLDRVVRRLALNRGRSRARGAAREERAARPEAVAPHDEALADLEVQERLIAAVKALAEPYRTTLWLRFHEGLAPAAIAARESTSKHTIESRLTRGLALLRAELDRRSGGDRAQWLGAALVLARPRGSWAASLIGGVTMKSVVVAVGAVLVLGLAWRLRSGERATTASPVELATSAAAETAGAAPVSRSADQRTSLAPGGATSTATETSGSLSIRVRWSDGTPASDVGLFVFPEDDPLGERHVEFLRTDADGRAAVDVFRAGTARIESDRGGELVVEVEVARRTEAVLDLPLGVTVEGTVAEVSGAPAAGAEVLLVSEATSWLATRVATRTRSNGAYRIRDVSPELSVSARSGALVPATLARLRGRAPGTTVRVDLTLGPEGAGLNGRVLDPELRPVAGARVAVGDVRGYSMEENGLAVECRGMPVVLSDVQGRFRAAGVDMTRGLPVAVLAEGFPIAVGGFAGDPSRAPSFAEIVLAPSCTLAGTVRDSSSAPIAGATVRALSFAGTQAHDIPFALPSATSDAEGRYALELLPPGCVAIVVDPPAGRALGHHFARVTLGAGGGALDVVLPEDDSIRGRIFDARGVPARGVSVSAYSIGGTSAIQRVRADDDGAFVFVRCAESPYVVDVRDDAGHSLLDMREVGPSREDLVLRLEEPGSLTGVLVEEEASARPPKAWLDGAKNDPGTYAEWEGTRFTFSTLQPGNYRLILQGRAMHRLGWYSVHAGEHVDVGTIHGARSGSMHVVFDPPPPGGFTFGLLDRTFDLAEPLDEFEPDLRISKLGPGSYFLRVDAEDRATHLQPVEIRSGEETEVVVHLAEGVARTLGFTLSDPAAEWNWIRVTLRDDLGRTRFGRREERYAERPSVLAMLAPGSYVLDAETDTGLVAHGAFTVDDLADQETPLVFELR